MKWMEMITVRSSRHNANLIASTLRDLLDDIARKEEQERIRIYHREGIDTDFGVILLHEGRKITANGSQFGLRLAAALKELGQVHHAVWREMTSQL